MRFFKFASQFQNPPAGNSVGELKRCNFHIISGLSTAGLFVLMLGMAFGDTQSVVPDGQTATTTSVSPTGQITVDIAPANSDLISHNTYQRFSVPTTGVNLNNQIVQAETIVNEVTSTVLSDIQGTLTILGPSAHVILANPNGITVNGGQFINTGNVALTTGSMSYDSSGLPVSTVNSGVISIGAAGLSSTMNELDLIAKSIRLGGAVSHTGMDTNSHVNLIGGSSVVDFDTGRTIGGILPWALPTAGSGSSSDSIVVEITDNGFIRSGRISITVTDEGAGVRLAGNSRATAGGFRLKSTGKLEVISATITAKGSVNVLAGSAELTSPKNSVTVITSEDSGVVIETQQGDIELSAATISGKTIASDNLASSGGITLIADQRIRIQSSTNNRSTLQSSDDNVVLNSSGAIEISGTDVNANKDFRLSTTGAVNLSDLVSNINENFRVLSTSEVAIDESVITAENNIRIDGTSVRFGASDPSQKRTELTSKFGSLIVKSTSGDVVNLGSLLQGNTATASDTESLGAVSIYSAGMLKNRSLSTNRLAVIFGEADDLHITAVGDVRNETGRMLSNDGIRIVSNGDIINDTRFTPGMAPYEVRHSKGKRFASSLWLKRKRTTTVTANYGEQLITGENAVILGLGDVALDGSNIQNLGGNITAGNLVMNTPGIFKNEARLTGALNYSLSCRWLCKSSGWSTVRSVGGNINVSGTLTVTADAGVSNIAGRMTSFGDFVIDSPMITSRSTFVPVLIERPTGLTGFFRGNRSWISAHHEWGAIGSLQGEVTFNGDVDLGNTEIVSTNDPEINGNESPRPEKSNPYEIGRNPIGLFWNLF